MKFFVLALLLAGSLGGRAVADTNMIAQSDWSAPIGFEESTIRGRWLMVAGSEPAYGGPKTDNAAMLFVELQNVTGAVGGSAKVYFEVSGLHFDLEDANGNAVPGPPGGTGWGGRGPFGPIWVVLPYNSTLRLFIGSGSRNPLGLHKGGEPATYWSISPNDTNTYYLSGTLTVVTANNGTLTVTPGNYAGSHEYHDWRGTLTFPKVKITATP